jgi:hypothetical protein
MVKSFSALALATLLGASVIALPVLAPKVEASEVAALSKGDRLQGRVLPPTCAEQVWPYVSTSCLRSTGGAPILEARLVTARR